MKKLFAVLLAVAMLLSLGVTAFADSGEPTPTTGTIVVANAGTHTYKAYKIFDAEVKDGKVQYTVSGALKTAIDTATPSLGFIYTEDEKIEADAGFSAADFSGWLIKNMSTLGLADLPLTTSEGTATREGVAPGYYLVVPVDDNGDIAAGTIGALATVIPGRTTQVQNKNDMPLNKEVGKNTDSYDDNGTGVNVGDKLYYKITTKTPASYKDNDYDYTFLITDKMTDGLTFNDDLTIEIAGPGDLADLTITVKKNGTVTVVPANTELVPAIVVKNSQSTGPMGPNEVRFGAEDAENGGKFTFEVSLAVASELLRQYTATDVTITYSATVNENAKAELLQNTAVLTYGDDNNLIIKDAETDNYISRIVVDKFESGNRTQKLPGAKFILYKQSDLSDPDTKQYYKLTPYQAAQPEVEDDPNTSEDESQDAVPEVKAKVEWVEEKANATVVTTDENGYAEFPYLADGTYYLEEIEAPVDYTRLLGPIEIEVDGSASVDGRLTRQQRVDALTNVANVANNPGSSMPSTGGVGATMLTIGGVALILAAGAYLVLRKRQEN